jgi:TetR/AcrR family transcriptional regulator, cholesterol catabolism regulator
LAAVAELLERNGADELTMPQVAEVSGISLRTVYRYYPTREQLLEASGRWIGGELLRQGYPQSLDDVADSFQAACRDFDRRPGLVRAGGGGPRLPAQHARLHHLARRAAPLR